MTRARALKQVIRTRAARTGERYTTARRHVLESQKAIRQPGTPPAAAPSRPAPPPPASKRASGISDAKILDRTGHGFEHWFDVLDRFGAVAKGHTAAARHLYEVHGVDGWYAQGITVAYERARGVRAVNQRCDGEYEVSVSKVVAGDTAAIIRALTSPRQRARIEVRDVSLMRALGAALEAPSSKGFVIRPDGLGRFRYRWNDTTVQFYLTPKTGNKVTVVVTNMKLASSDMVGERRTAWREMLNSLAAIL